MKPATWAVVSVGLWAILSSACSESSDGETPPSATGGRGGASAQGGGGGAASAAGGAGGALEMGGMAGAAQAQGGAAGGETGGQPGGAAGASGGTGGAAMADTCNSQTCIDFESGDLGSNWRATSQDAEVVEGMAAHGKYSVYLPTKRNGRGVSVRPSKPITHKDPIFGRYYMFLEKPHTWSTSYMMRTGRNPSIEFGGLRGQWQFTPAGNRTTMGTVPSGKWVCVQFHIETDPIALTVTVDGDDVGTVAGGGDPFNEYFLLTIGMGQYHPETINEDIDLWVDDIELSDKAVPCLDE